MDTSEVVIQPPPRTRDLAIVGAAAGLTAGLAMAMWATLTSVWHGVGLLASFELFGATFTGDHTAPAGFGPAMYGLFVHATTAAGLGILFTALLPNCASCRFATGAGLGFALAVLLAMTFVVTPVANPVLREAVDTFPRSWVIQHALFGLTLGVVPAYWRYYQDESVRVRIVQASRRAIVVRRPQLPAAPPIATFPRIKRAKTVLKRAEVFATPPKPLRRGPHAAS